MTSLDAAAVTPPEPARSSWRWLGPAFAVAWLALLGGSISQALALHTWRGNLAVACFVVFALAYVVGAAGMSRRLRVDRRLESSGRRLLTVALGVMVPVAVLLVLLVGDLGLDAFPYLAVVGAMALGRYGGVWVAATTGVGVVAALALGVATGRIEGIATGILATGLSVWVFMVLLQRSRAQVRTAETEQLLALATQRNTFARDLHDIVGHSLSVVTMKAALAQRLLDSEPERARAELAELEELTRHALDDVRRAVAGYREISLTAELVGARDVLAAAGIVADLPTAADDVDPELRDLFAWTVREGVTNVVRHSRAEHCRIILQRRSLVIEDDGRGSGEPSIGGSGLIGLSERAHAVGAVVISETVRPRGFRLTVQAKGER